MAAVSVGDRYPLILIFVGRTYRCKIDESFDHRFHHIEIIIRMGIQ